MVLKKILCLLVMCLGITLMTACGGDAAQETEAPQSFVFKGMFAVNPETGVADKKDIVDQFNEAYKDRYFFDVEWESLSAADYRIRLRQLNVLNQMPIVISDAAMDHAFYKTMVNNGRLVNLADYMDEEWKSIIREDILASCTHEDGSIYLMPITSPVYSFSGIIYNRKMLAEAGYETFPQDWDSFFDCMDKLKALGYTPLAMHGGDSFWADMLLATAYLAGSEEGRAFLNEEEKPDFDQPCVREMFEFLKRLFDYSFSDAINIDYEKAQARFYGGRAAMLANGYWILESMELNQQATLSFAPFPGNTLMASPKMTAWAVTSGYSEEETAAAVEFLRFRTFKSDESADEFLYSSGTPVMTDYKKSALNVDYIFPNYQLSWPSEVQNAFFNEYIPLYIHGDITLDEFMAELTTLTESLPD